LENFIETLAATVVGGLITFLASRHYYVKASKDLEGAAARLQTLTTLIIRGMEEARLATFTRDGSGNPIGLVIEMSAVMPGKGTLSGTLDSVPAPKV
jgi:hypothetical protein